MSQPEKSPPQLKRGDAPVHLQGSDGQVIEVPLNVALHIKIVEFMVPDNDPVALCGTKIPLPLVSSDVLAKVVEYCRFMQLKQEAKLTDEKITEWETGFLLIELGQLFEIMNAANYFFVQELVDLTCREVARRISKAKSVKELREMFGEEDDHTAEKKEQIATENSWTA